ncbi:MAG TPA: hypothetical protein VM099_15725 [Gemmatimonadaceae bacterium]|nr:hypothetical protein [Gemmatimonadaceae bacterium]
MYGGHIGIALAGKGYRSTIPLWLLVFATQLPDWADAAVCTLTNAPSAMLSHSIPAVAAFALVLSLLYYGAARDWRSSGLVACIVGSHAVADYATGLKPTWPGGPFIGLQLYHRPALDFVLEAVVIIIGWMIYQRSLPADRRRSPLSKWLLTCLLLLQFLASLSFWLYPGGPKC